MDIGRTPEMSWLDVVKISFFQNIDDGTGLASEELPTPAEASGSTGGCVSDSPPLEFIVHQELFDHSSKVFKARARFELNRSKEVAPFKFSIGATASRKNVPAMALRCRLCN